MENSRQNTRFKWRNAKYLESMIDPATGDFAVGRDLHVDRNLVVEGAVNWVEIPELTKNTTINVQPNTMYLVQVDTFATFELTMQGFKALTCSFDDNNLDTSIQLLNLGVSHDNYAPSIQLISSELAPAYLVYVDSNGVGSLSLWIEK